MPAVFPERQQAVIGHLPARLEPGSWARPGPSSPTENHRKPSGPVTLASNKREHASAADPRNAPYRRLGAAEGCAAADNGGACILRFRCPAELACMAHRVL